MLFDLEMGQTLTLWSECFERSSPMLHCIGAGGSNSLASMLEKCRKQP